MACCKLKLASLMLDILPLLCVKAGYPLGQGRRLAIFEHLLPFFVGQAVVRRPRELILGEDAALGHLEDRSRRPPWIIGTTA